MFETLFWVTYVALWLLMILVLAALFSLYRYHGTLFINSSEGRATQGPKLNEPLKSMHLRDTAGMDVLMGESSNSSQFVFFASTKCAPCIKARDALGLFAERHKGTIETIVVCQGKDEHVREFTKDMPEHIKAVSDPHWHIGASLRISTTPFALITDRGGSVIAKGMPDNEDGFQWFSQQLYARDLTKHGIEGRNQ